MSDKLSLKERLAQNNLLMAVGVYDALTALIAEQAGFEAAFVSGSAVAYSQLGRPDIGLVTLTEMAQVLDRIRDRVDSYLLVDADSGFGNAFNVQRSVRMLERAGANGIQLEDQLNTKSPKEVITRPVISIDAMVGKIKSALDARQSDATVISARSDAVFTLGVDQAMDRAEAYLDAGADMVFIEGLKDKADIERLVQICSGRAPVLYNLLDPAAIDANTLESLGLSMALYPGVMINNMANSGRKAVSELAKDLGVSDKTFNAEPINSIIGSGQYLDKGYSYEEE